MAVRKVSFIRETAFSDMGKTLERPITRAAALAVIDNPLAGRFVPDLAPLIMQGAELGEMLMKDLIKMLPHPAVSYGKAAIVGTNGEMEHGGALLHPRLGKPVRAAVGGGEAIICSNVKVGAMGASIDVPLAHKDDVWSFDHFDTLTLSIADAPRPDEIVVIIAIADGGRLHPRVGQAPVR